MRRLSILTVLLTLATVPAQADWPQWRGPGLNGVSPDTEAPLTWGPHENVAWRTPLPARSASTPVVAGGRVFLLVAREETQGELELWALDRTDGSVTWRRSLGGGNAFLRKHNLSSPSPVTDGERVWALTGTGRLAAFSADGESLWSRDLQEEYGEFGLLWGYASSPLLHGDSLYVQVLHGFHTDAPSYLLRVDTATGETRWRVERPTDAQRESPDGYATPMMVQGPEGEELVITGGDVVTGHDPATGRELWRADVLNPEDSPAQRIVASPVPAGGLVLASGKRGPVVAIRPGGQGDVTDSHVVWIRDEPLDVPTPVSDGERLYLVTDRGLAICLDLQTGERVWGPERLANGTYSASPVRIGDRIYATSEDGTTTVFRAGPRFEILATNELGGYTLASPAVSDGQIFLRTADALWALGTRSGS